jgi:hypothetical protein
MGILLVIFSLIGIGVLAYLVGFLSLGLGRLLLGRMTFEERLLAFLILGAVTVLTVVSIVVPRRSIVGLNQLGRSAHDCNGIG